MCQVVAYKKLKTMGNDKIIRPIKGLQLLMIGGCLQWREARTENMSAFAGYLPPRFTLKGIVSQ